MNIRPLLVALLPLLLYGCATTAPRPQGISEPIYHFTGRLIVIEPNHRWQVTIDWQGDAEQGHVRLVHAASNRIVELMWQKASMRLRDNQSGRGWQPISAEEIERHGILLPPRQLARILAGDMPPSLVERGHGTWEGELNRTTIRVRWSGDRHRLELTDIRHGRQAIVIFDS